MATAQHEVLTSEELREEVDRLTQEKLGLSVDRFWELYRAGHLDQDSVVVSRLVVLARFLNEQEEGQSSGE